MAEKLKGGYQRVGGISTPKGAAKDKSASPPPKAAKAATPVRVPEPAKAAASSVQKAVRISGKLPSGKKKADYSKSLAAAGYQSLWTM